MYINRTGREIAGSKTNQPRRLNGKRRKRRSAENGENYDEFKEFCTKHDRIVVKPLDGCDGVGIGLFEVNKKNIKTFVKRLHQEVLLNTMSKLDEQVENIDEDLQDVLEWRKSPRTWRA